MISGLHIILNVYDADAARAFFSEALGLKYVDAGEGWLIFALPPSELACHPGADSTHRQSEGDVELFLMCKDIEATRLELESKGIKFAGAIEERGYGSVTFLQVPGYGNIGLYEPHHTSPLNEFS